MYKQGTGDNSEKHCLYLYRYAIKLWACFQVSSALNLCLHHVSYCQKGRCFSIDHNNFVSGWMHHDTPPRLSQLCLHHEGTKKKKQKNIPSYDIALSFATPSKRKQNSFKLWSHKVQHFLFCCCYAKHFLLCSWIWFLISQ